MSGRQARLRATKPNLTYIMKSSSAYIAQIPINHFHTPTPPPHSIWSTISHLVFPIHFLFYSFLWLLGIASIYIMLKFLVRLFALFIVGISIDIYHIDFRITLWVLDFRLDICVQNVYRIQTPLTHLTPATSEPFLHDPPTHCIPCQTYPASESDHYHTRLPYQSGKLFPSPTLTSLAGSLHVERTTQLFPTDPLSHRRETTSRRSAPQSQPSLLNLRPLPSSS